MSVPFVGPSYNLNRPAAIQRTIGLIPMPVEPGNERSPWTFKDWPGLVEFADLEFEIRGMLRADGRVFVVAGNQLFELDELGEPTERGSLSSATGKVGMASNGRQLAISDGARLYVMILATNAYSSAEFVGKAKIAYLNQRILFVIRDSGTFGWSDLADAGDIDPLNIASAESSPDDLVGIDVDHLEVFLFGEETTEPWQNTTSTAIFERNSGGVSEVGAAAEFTIQKVDNRIYWLSSTRNGSGAVYALNVYQPQRVSTDAVEGALTGLDLSQATAFSLEGEKSAFYCLNVPGLDSTLVYDANTGQWMELCELTAGELAPYRATCHVFGFGYHLVGDDTGKVYRLDKDTHTNDGDVLLRERIMPNAAAPFRDKQHVTEFNLDCERGTGGYVQMQYSLNGGKTWSAWKSKSVGELGVYNKLVRWRRIGAGRDLVIRVRCTDDVAFNPVSGVAR